jgi:predicted RNase H-like HicB family nuclease
MKKESYMFPSIVTIEDDCISIRFPDLEGCLPCANTFQEAIKNAKEAMALHLISMEEEGTEIPNPTASKDIGLESNQIIMLIEANMLLCRGAMRTR